MKLKKQRTIFTDGICLAVLAAMSVPTMVRAESVNIRTLSPGSGHDYVFSEDALLDSRKGFGLGLTGDYLNDPLVRTNADNTAETRDLITDMFTLDVQGTYRLHPKWKVGVGLPLHLVSPVGGSGKFAISDMRAFSKHRLLGGGETKPWALAFMIDLRAPTGSRQYYLSDDSVGVGGRFVLEHDLGFMKLAGNAGYMYASNSGLDSENISYKNRIPLSLSALVPIGPRWSINVEGGGAISLPTRDDQNPSELYVGANYALPKDFTFFGGGAIGNFNGVGSNDFRIILGLRTNCSEKQESAPVSVAPTPAPTPAPENPTQPVKPRVVFTPRQIIITEEVRFETGKDVLTASGQKLLDEVADVIKTNLMHFKTIAIEGHTDERGTDKFNLRLSQGRAEAVRYYLMSRGVAKNRLTAVGYGERRLKSKGDTTLSKEQRWAIDRRVEFKVNNK